MNRKASIGWPYVVAIIIGLLVLLALIFIAMKSNFKMGSMISGLKDFIT